MMLQKLIVWAKEFRLLFLLFVVLPVTLGSAIALKYDGGGVSRFYYGISVVAILLLHAGTIAYNDLFDYISGNDVINKARTMFTGGTGLIPEFLKPLEVFTAGSACFGFCVLIGLFIAATRSLLLLPIGMLGVGMGIFYSVPPLKLSYRLLGEITWFLSIPLIAMGAFIVQVPISTPEIFVEHLHTVGVIIVASLPLAFMGTAGIFILEFPDREADRAVRKWNLMSVFGKSPGVYIFGGISLLAYASLLAGIVINMIPIRGALMFLTVPLMALAAWGLVKYQGGAKGIVLPIVYVVAACIMTGIVLIISYL
jgi:1,4-dihydroxy-2-naphthoate polyprenyltransferase